MSVKYIKDNKTQEVIYPITKSECIVDAHSINNYEIDQLFDGSPEDESSDPGMDYLNYDGLKHYHKKISEEVQTGLDNVQVDLTGYATEQWVEQQNYLKEHQDISGKVNVADFEEATLVTSAALNTLNQNLAVKESDIQLLQTQSLELQNQISTLAASMYKGVPVVAQTTDATIAPNVWNVWGEVTSLNITKGTEIAGIVNNFMVRFTAGEGCVVNFLDFTLQWYGGGVPEWAVGNTYEISIVDNIALWAEFEPAS